MLDKHEHILWLDCDGTLFKFPGLCYTQGQNIDILACPHRTVADRDWHVGIMALRSNERTKAFVDAWIAQVEANAENGITDERAFMKVMEAHPDVRFAPLPDHYHVVMLRGANLTEAVWGMGISKDADKQQTYRSKDRLEWL